MKKKSLKASAVKLLLIPVYALFLCAVMYLIGDAKDVWDKWSAWVDKKFG